MNKLIITLAAVAALSTASFASNQDHSLNGAERDAPWVFENHKPSNKATIYKMDVNKDALSTGKVSKKSFDPFRLSGSQTR